jgi:hypothetical protein
MRLIGWIAAIHFLLHACAAQLVLPIPGSVDTMESASLRGNLVFVVSSPKWITVDAGAGGLATDHRWVLDGLLRSIFCSTHALLSLCYLFLDLWIQWNLQMVVQNGLLWMRARVA